MLSLAARHADIVGIAPAAVTGEIDAESARTATPAATDAKLDWIRAAAGDRFDDLELNVLLFAAMVGPDRQSNAEAIAALFDIPVDDALASPHLCFGSVEEICDDLEARRERWGISYVTFPGDALEAAAPDRRPAVRDLSDPRARASVRRRQPMCTILATDGTRFLSSRKSM